MSDIASAGIARGSLGYGKTCRKDVLGRVDVPVVPGTAGRACPVPSGKGKLREPVPARRAGLRTRVPTARHDQLAAVSLTLVSELATELAPPAVRDSTGQPAVADHARYVQVLDHYRVVLADQPGAGAVEEILPGVTDLAVGAGDLRGGLAPVPAIWLATCQTPLVAGQIPGLPLQVARRTRPRLAPPSRLAGNRHPPRPEGRDSIRRSW